MGASSCAHAFARASMDMTACAHDGVRGHVTTRAQSWHCKCADTFVAARLNSRALAPTPECTKNTKDCTHEVAKWCEARWSNGKMLDG
eukprot:3308482-Alexandrium_andersonii.AAC.1